jgi:hypothetical protein
MAAEAGDEVMICKNEEIAELQIHAPELVAKRWREGVEKAAVSPDILKFGITRPGVRKFEYHGSSRTCCHDPNTDYLKT